MRNGVLHIAMIIALSAVSSLYADNDFTTADCFTPLAVSQEQAQGTGVRRPARLIDLDALAKQVEQSQGPRTTDAVLDDLHQGLPVFGAETKIDAERAARAIPSARETDLVRLIEGIAQAQATGDREAYNRLWAQLDANIRPRLQAYFLLRVGKSGARAQKKWADIDDLTQETMVSLIRYMPKFVANRGERDPLGIIFHIANMRVKDYWRRKYRKNQDVTVTDVDRGKPDEESVAATNTRARDLDFMVFDGVWSMDSDQRIVWVNVFKGDSYAEVGQRMGIPVDKVADLHFRAQLHFVTKERPEDVGEMDLVLSRSVFTQEFAAFEKHVLQGAIDQKQVGARKKQLDVLWRVIAQKKRNKDIADEMGLTEQEVANARHEGTAKLTRFWSLPAPPKSVFVLPDHVD